MNVTVLYNETGGIDAIAQPVDLSASGSKFSKVTMMPGPGQKMIQVALTAEQQANSLLELHEQYRVDTTTLQLVKK